jgi:uncharacterized membrane protein YhaH (DUF805 family)
MAAILGSIRRGLTGLTRFSGRDSRAQFWPYALFVTGLTMVAAAVGMGVTMGQVFARLQKFAAEHPDQATVLSGPDGYSIQIQGDHPELIMDFTPMVVIDSVAVAAAVLLLAAAVTRRLHDRGRQGYWGLAPLPFLAVGLSLLPRVFAGSGEGAESLILALFFNNVVYLVLLIVLVVLLAKGSDLGVNRFGPPAA